MAPLFTTSDIDDVAQYRGKGKHIQFSCYQNSAAGTKPFLDGFLIALVWNDNYMMQIALDDEAGGIKIRNLSGNSWTTWRVVSIS